MRNRFLTADYFTAGGSFQTLDFICLPLPHLPPPNNLSFSQDFLHSFHDIPVFSIPCKIDKLPIDHALSKFFSDVIPHVIDEVNFAEKEIGRSKENRMVLISEEHDVTTSDHSSRNIIEIAQFEIPEMDLSLLQAQKSAVQSQMEDLNILSQISVAECTTDMPTSELTLPNLLEIQQSVYSVEDISLEYTVEQKDDFLEDAGSFEGQLHFHNLQFPHFEVDEESLGIVRSIHMEDELIIFESIEPLQWTELDVVFSDGKELLSSIEFDLMKYLSDHCLAVQCLEVELHCSNFTSQMDFISVVEQPHCEEYSTFCQKKADGDVIGSMNPHAFEEFQFFDQDPSYFCEVFSDVANEIEAEACEFMFGETTNFRNFSELIVCHELTLMDDSFKSLPVPIISVHGRIRSLHSVVEQLLVHVESQSSSTSDSLYLDWHFVEEDNFGKYSSCRKILWEIDTCKIDASMYLIDSRKQIYNFILSKDCSNEPNWQDCKEMLNLPSTGVSMFRTSVDEKFSDSLHNHGDRKRLNRDVSPKTGIEKVPSFVESMSSDLEFFLNPRNYAMGKESKPADKSVDIITTCPVLFSNDAITTNACTVVQQQWNVRLHRVQLSDNILLLIDNFRKVFLALLESDTELRQSESQSLDRAGENLTLLCLPKEELMDRLKKKSSPSTYSAHNDDNIMLLMMLCAIKQMAFYLCYYGVHATYLYVDRLCRSLQCFKSRISCLYNLIKDAHERAEKEICEIHPSLSVVHEILETNLRSTTLKILIVSDRVFWWPLKRLLKSMKISYNELHHFSAHASQHVHEFMDSALKNMISSDCCLVSYEYVSASFPFHEFGLVLEYGGSNGSSIISAICPKLDGLPPLYFLKVELEDLSVSKALSGGVYISKNSEFKMDADIHSISTQIESKNKLEDLLNFVPIEETYNEGLDKDEDGVCSTMPVKSMSVAMESKQINSCKPFCHDIVIIVNTQNFEKDMVISRRSTYQRILALEKEGAQVVERDIDLPVDIIVSASICLSWYDGRNIGKKASAPDVAFSCLPLCVESIAANTLTSLSFAFSCCILIFEGEGNFLSGILESSDELYAAAASLGIDIQLFCSYSSEMTDEIILSCIEVGIKSHRGLCPKMPDSESLAESFLTAFPSINPLSAHAILSSGGTLVEFLELSDKGRIHALQKYQVPNESIALLSVTSRYGVREDSKSGMTDCSSSVSSAPDSETTQFRSASQKKLKYTHNLYDADEPPNDLFHMEPLKLFSDNLLHPPKASTSCDSWLPGSTEIFDESGKSSLSFDDKLFRHRQGLDTDMMLNSSTMSRFHDFPDAKDLKILDEMEKPTMAQIGVNYPRWRSGASATNNFSRKNTKASANLQETLIGEVIDIDDTPAFRNFSDRSPLLLDGEKDYAGRKSRMSKPSSGASKLRIFTDPVETDSASNAWVSGRDNRQSSREEIRERYDTVENKKNSFKCQKRPFQEDVTETNPHNSDQLSFQEKGPRNYGGTPLSNALHSTQPQQGSPWTIEFLNRIREKSRLRQQSLPCNLSPPRFNYSRNASKVTKRKSPSILEFYKYQGGSASEKIVKEKRQRSSSQRSNSSKNNKSLASSHPSLTPIDKRASRTLSFATNGNVGQSKLVWSDISSHTSNRRF
ncbi:shortage in chiasmata 1 [Abeliophyllum distichum]|uniref:Shortage in chiasmata 1 n=1 Tax=Abeliophyllum distichum TaxID=126358 RepID=A0ABD1UQI8_9LAMI